MKLSKKKLESFLRSQLMTLIALDLVENNVNIGPAARGALQDAKLVVGHALDRLTTDYPKTQGWIEPMTKELAAPHG